MEEEPVHLDRPDAAGARGDRRLRHLHGLRVGLSVAVPFPQALFDVVWELLLHLC